MDFRGRSLADRRWPHECGLVVAESATLFVVTGIDRSASARRDPWISAPRVSRISLDARTTTRRLGRSELAGGNAPPPTSSVGAGALRGSRVGVGAGRPRPRPPPA